MPGRTAPGRHHGGAIRRLPAVVVLAAMLWVSMAVSGCSEGRAPRPTATPTRTRVVPTLPATATLPPSPTLTLSPTSTPSPLPTATPSPSSTPTEAATEPPTETPTAVPTATASTTVLNSVGGALVPATPVVDFGSAFDNRIWVGLYGTAGSRGLGVLGTTPVTEAVAMAQQQALAYQELLTDTQVVPFFHMVVTIADPVPGADGDYVHRVSAEAIQRWISAASAHGIYSVVDIQPGHSPITVELAFVETFVRQPGVHLAIDPEFLMANETDIPGNRIGVMTGAQVNLVQAWLSGVAEVAGERKALIIHQFDDRMFTGKEDLVDYPLVDLVWDADGFGGPGAKIADYRQYAAEPGFEYGGFKLFYDYDTPVMSPADVLRLVPRPAFVVYQ